MIKRLLAGLMAFLLALSLGSCDLPARLGGLIPGMPSAQNGAAGHSPEDASEALSSAQGGAAGEDPSDFQAAPLQPGDYTPEDVEAATKAVLAIFDASFPGCVLTRLEYDSAYSAAQRAEWAQQYGTEEILVLRSDFSAGEAGGDGSLEPGKEYKDWDWVLARNADGLWEVMTWGYL